MCPKGSARLFAIVPSVFAVIGKHCRASDRCRHGGSGEPGGDARAVARAGELLARVLALVALAVLVGTVKILSQIDLAVSGPVLF